MRKSLREIFKTLFLVLASVNLGISSEMLPLGIIFALGFLYLHWRLEKPTPLYKKRFAYGAIIPFALWWVVTPEVENGISPYVIFIPAWYLLFLAWLQKRSLGRGGFEAFVIFDGVAALLLGMFQAGREGTVVGVAGLLLAILAYRRQRTAWYKYLLFLLLVAFFGLTSFGGWQYWKNHRHYDGRWAKDYMERSRVMGFDPVVSLGSFSNNYSSKYNSQVILRVWDRNAPEYLRAAVYEKYVGKIWKLPTKPEQKLYPAYYQIDYPVFELVDSVTKKESVRSVWVQSALDNFGFLFAPFGAVGVAAKNADSLDYYKTGIFAGANGKHGDWYYFVDDSLDSSPDSSVLQMDPYLNASANLQIGKTHQKFIDSVATAMDLPQRDSTQDTLQGSLSDGLYERAVLSAIRNYFVQNFRYSLVVPGAQRGNVDPLRTFWTAKEGFCEYYATLAVLLLRHQGIQARYVTGFAHPERTEGRDYVVFRRHHSHSWVEVLWNGRWYSFDPTPPLRGGLFAAPSLWQSKWEGIKGRFARLFHLLKEGQWRLMVTDWQTATQGILDSPWIYGLPLLLLLVILVRVLLKRRKGKVQIKPDLRALKWVRSLDHAEKQLKRQGFVRRPGETVGAFIARIEPAALDPKSTKALETLCEYERERWR